MLLYIAVHCCATLLRRACFLSSLLLRIPSTAGHCPVGGSLSAAVTSQHALITLMTLKSTQIQHGTSEADIWAMK